MSGDSNWELIILDAVHGFYMQVLQQALQEDILLPPGLDSASLQRPVDLQKSLTDLRRWLKLLDLAITPRHVA